MNYYGFFADSNGGQFGRLRWRNKPLFLQKCNYISRLIGGGFGWIEFLDLPNPDRIEAFEEYTRQSLELFYSGQD